MKININSILRIFSLTVVIFSIFFIYNTYKKFQMQINNIEKKLSLLDKNSTGLYNQQQIFSQPQSNQVTSTISRNQNINSNINSTFVNDKKDNNIVPNCILQSEYQKYKETNNLQYDNTSELSESNEDNDNSSNPEEDDINNEETDEEDVDEEDEEDVDEEDVDEEDVDEDNKKDEEDEEDVYEENEKKVLNKENNVNENNEEEKNNDKENKKILNLEENIVKDKKIEAKTNNIVLEDGINLNFSQLDINEIENLELNNFENISEILDENDKLKNMLELNNEENSDKNEKIDDIIENNETKITNDEKFNYYKNLNLKELKDEYKKLYNKDSKPRIKKNDLINELINKNN